ncbi:hypothetical protein L596_012206 [Steinernema carpocapsae]|uniref:G-protein coupled receptors family 1 profile domain-containing protein n=1 Tax=Steinernema carpocapsae TaxID=34508 RepID=A0A4U5NX73_STECR|nr:hypothetical protein L596_012206 [Steinernema carpocapsae]
MTLYSVDICLFYGSTFLCLLTGILFFYITLSKTPPDLKTYRNNLFNLSFWYLLCAFTAGALLQPVPVDINGETCTKCVGFGGYISQSSVYVLIGCMFVFSSNISMALLLSFLHRYVHLAHPKWSLYMRSTQGHLVLVSVQVTGTLTATLSAYEIVTCLKEIEQDGHKILCANPDGHLKLWFGLIAAGMLVLCSLMFIFMVLSIKTMRAQKLLWSSKTYRLQLRLTVNLVTLTLLPAVCEIIPIMLSAIFISLKSPYSLMMYSITTHLPFVSVVCSSVITLGFITPYRKAVLALFRIKNGSQKISVVSINRASETHK